MRSVQFAKLVGLLAMSVFVFAGVYVPRALADSPNLSPCESAMKALNEGFGKKDANINDVVNLLLQNKYDDNILVNFTIEPGDGLPASLNLRRLNIRLNKDLVFQSALCG